ncbi:MAG TPA: serine protease [Actinomycetales bacterium]|nr:serine protease [Actinomycetales bacterium]
MKRGRLIPIIAAALVISACSVLPPKPPPLGPTPQGTSTSNVSNSSGEADSPDGFQSAQRIAVRVRNVGCQSLSTGSGFALDENTLVTNRHVIEDSAELQLETYDGRDVAVAASTIASFSDLALVTTVDALPHVAPIATQDAEIDDLITVIGYPKGGELTTSTGRIISSEQDPLDMNLGEVFYTSAPVEPGSSGSAVLNTDGELVGVIYAKSGSGSLFVPVSTLHELLESDANQEPLPGC